MSLTAKQLFRRVYLFRQKWYTILSLDDHGRVPRRLPVDWWCNTPPWWFGTPLQEGLQLKMLLAVSEEKKDLRKKLLAKLLALTGEELKRRSQNVEKRLSSLPIYKYAKLVMVYYPLRGEVDILRMVRRDLGLKRFCFPFMNLEKKDLEAYEVNNLEDDFSVGPFGVMQPLPGKTKKVDIKEIDMVIVPALAFDRKYNRLGRGAGFYDRFLKRLNPPCKKVGIAFNTQVLENLPTHPSLDEKVDVIVSEHFCI